VHVTQLLAHKGDDVATISKDRTIADAVNVLRERGIGALVVTGSGTPLKGILSERDVVRALALRGASVLSDTVESLMSTDVATCTPDTTCTDLMGLMTEHRIRHVPVMSDGRLVGLVSIGDVVKARFDELEREKRDLLEYVSAR